mmetsp:Transcript_16320/g.24698  ORF Transcript_16320/g.24698 Transcript_16320/m.24698 type:complete len:514 (+) Transcript_16320:181-1722(+)|eukprot:CAMPEP_0178912340 /NCGR_PEP_ID=MMETSP0786-20121207/10208_1 /TAXON_ID=186022 /ORGANISM="Thalassionema frauenfeldii, Strain CCMP 1798" /LENGTH=513 /DNA_ID=CAMNT_0020584911 /DNA_START=149 /DNA_END=1690 /DNA_ORIENTATION=-
MGKGGQLLQQNSSLDEDPTIGRAIRKDIPISVLETKNSLDECWLAYDGLVYDVTHWIPKHPGGIRAIMSAAGQDATSVMNSLHHPSTLETMMKRTRCVGRLVVSESDAEKKKKQQAKLINDDFEQLGQELIRDGWYEPKLSAYIFPVLRVIALFAFGLCLVYRGDGLATWLDTLQVILGSISIGLFFQNIAFLGHDAGHGSITGRFDYDLYLGLLVGNGLTGIDLGWWKSTHYVHHSATNSLHDDPDIQHMPLLCFEERFSDDGRWSSYHGRYLPGLQHVLARVLVPYQHWYFYPVLCVARFSLHIMSIGHVLQTCPWFYSQSEQIVTEDNKVKEKYAWPKPSTSLWLLQAGTLIFYWTMLYTYLTSLETLFTSALSLFCIYVTTGILHVQIVLSHISMEYCEDGHGVTGASSVGSYYEWQALSTMDVDCPPWMDWFHGGLQFQLEHHLFPRIPRRNLRKLMAKTDAIFAKHGIPVTRKTFFEANAQLLRHMKCVGEAVARRVVVEQQHVKQQ